MPINPRFRYSGQRWAPPANLACLAISTALWIHASPNDWELWFALLFSQIAMGVMWYRSHQAATAFQLQLEVFTAVNIGKAIVESNIALFRSNRTMPSQILEEAMNDIQKES